MSDDLFRTKVGPPTAEDVLVRILAEGDAWAGENLFHVQADLDVTDGEQELIMEMLDEIQAIRDYVESVKEDVEDPHD